MRRHDGLIKLDMDGPWLPMTERRTSDVEKRVELKPHT
jgi:hypothetical protein